jgi:DNA-binding CsgD family transcriptional regulator
MSLPVFSLSDFVATLFAPGLDMVSFRARSARLLREALDCQIVSFATLAAETRRLDIDFDPFVPELGPALEGFGRHMAKYPCFNFDPRVADGKPFLRGDFLSDEEFYSAPVYLEGFALAGITDHAAVLLPSTDGSVFFLGLEKQGGTYRPQDRERLIELQPHLANARLLAQAFEDFEHSMTDPSAFIRLGFSPRESDTLALLSTGKTNAEIASVLGISLPTVKGHVKSIFDKLGADNRHAALLQARRLLRPAGGTPMATTRRASTVAAHS